MPEKYLYVEEEAFYWLICFFYRYHGKLYLHKMMLVKREIVTIKPFPLMGLTACATCSIVARKWKLSFIGRSKGWFSGFIQRVYWRIKEDFLNLESSWKLLFLPPSAWKRCHWSWSQVKHSSKAGGHPCSNELLTGTHNALFGGRHPFQFCVVKTRNRWPWLGSSVGYSVTPICKVASLIPSQDTHKN